MHQITKAKEAVKIISTMEDNGIVMDLVEQPVHAHDFKGMQYVTKHVYTQSLHPTEDE